MRIPWGKGVISDTTKVQETCAGSDVYKLIPQPILVDNFIDLANFIEVDPDNKINVVSNTVTFDGDGSSYLTHGIRKAFDRNIGYVEIKFSTPVLSGGHCSIGISNTAALIYAGVLCMIQDGGIYFQNSNAIYSAPLPIEINTFYTLGFSIDKSADGTSWKRLKITIGGGVYASETLVGYSEFAATAITTATPTFYVTRRLSNPAALLIVKEYREYFGLPTVPAPVVFTSDAGTGKTINGVNFTNLALPIGIVDTNLEFDYSFDDGTPSYSSKYSLTALKALGAISGSKRYLRIRVYQNSNGTTQTYGSIVNADDAVTSVGAGASAPGAFVLTATSKARGNVLLKWTPSTGFDSCDVYVNGSIPTGYADLVVCEKLITLTADSSNEIYIKAKNGTGNTDSNTLTVATGKNASIVAGITNNIVQELQQVTVANGYTFTVNTVEQERMTERINNRLPMLEVCGPAVSIETKTTRGQQYTTEYSIIYRALINDDDLSADPATKQTEDIAADIIMALMDDHTHGGLAIMTTVTDYYHTLDEAANGTTMFNVIVTFEILTHVDMFNPYKIG